MDKITLNFTVTSNYSKKPEQSQPDKKVKPEKQKIIQNIKERFSLKKEISQLMDKWISVMANSNVYNQEYKTFTLSHIIKEEYGWSCRIYAPFGLSFEMLEKVKPIIQDNLSCTFIYRIKKNTNFVMAKIIINGFNVGDYTPPKIKCNEVYIGNSCDNKPVIISMHEYPHILLSGANGSGKSRLLDCILTTLIYNCTYNIELYLIQVAKSDLIIYEDCIQCRAFADDFNKTELILEHIIEEMNKRDKLIRPLRKQGKGSNISDYNKLNPNNPLTVVYVVFDEMASLMDSSGDENQLKKQKQKIVANIEKIAQYGRSLGVFGIFCLQRPTATMLSPFVKSQSNLRISFKQNNSKSSEIAMDDPSIALNLEKRIAVYMTYDYDYIKTPFINDDIILKYIKHSSKPGHETILDIQKPISKENTSEKSYKKPTGRIKKDNTPIVTFDKVDPQKQEEIKNNISKIPNYVPYNPNPNIKVIDQTDMALKPSEKPFKGGKVHK